MMASVMEGGDGQQVGDAQRDADEGSKLQNGEERAVFNGQSGRLSGNLADAHRAHWARLGGGNFTAHQHRGKPSIEHEVAGNKAKPVNGGVDGPTSDASTLGGGG